jgi:predicted MFS family arabinose efflux permease
MRIPRSAWPMFGLLGQSCVARMSDHMAGIVYGWGLLETTGSSAGPSLVMAASFGALVVGTFFAGALVRQLGARFVALLGLWTSLTAAVLIAFLTATNITDPTLIAVIGALGAIFDGPAGIASETNYPQIARLARFDLLRLNAIDDGLDNAAGVFAPTLGALGIAAFGLSGGATIVAVLSLIAALLCTISLPAFKVRSTGFGSMALALRHLAGDWLLLVLTLVVAMIVAVFVALELVILPRVLLKSAEFGTTALAAYLLSAGIAGIAGALMTAPLARRFSLSNLISGALAIMAMGIALLAIDMSWATFVISGALTGLPAGIVTPAISSLYQMRPPRGLRADLQAILGGLIFSAAPLAILAAGAAADRIELTPLLFWLAIGAAAAAICARLFLPAMMLKEALRD